ncbi:TolC family protein [Hydrogenimonas cancrithermarum]|nr:TolC family protein [Hydrogenimonas cancrithermarum]
MIRLIFSLIAFSSLLSAEPKVLKIDDLVTIALEKSPDLDIWRADYNASKQRTRQAEGERRPRVDIGAGAGSTVVKSASIDGTQSSGLMTGTLSVSQLLYDFGKTGKKIEAHRLGTDTAHATLQQKISDKIFDVKEAYYYVLQAKNLIAVNEENVRLNEKQLHRAERYYEAGIRTKIDVSDAKVNLIQARKSLNSARYEYRRARIWLEKVAGLDPHAVPHRLYAPEIDYANADKSLPVMEKSLEELVAFAYSHRMELRSHHSRIESAKARLASLRGGYYPKFLATLDYTHNEVADSDLELYVPKDQANALVILKWNLYEGGKTDARIEEARAELLKRLAQYNDVKSRIRQEVADAVTRALRNRDEVILAQSLAEAAKEKFEQAQKRYEHGIGDYIELQQARQGYIDASSSLVVSYYTLFTSLAAVERAVGK